jgi:hypothetical protein
MKALWDNVDLRTFIDICVEEVNSNTLGLKIVATSFDWKKKFSNVHELVIFLFFTFLFLYFSVDLSIICKF